MKKLLFLILVASLGLTQVNDLLAAMRSGDKRSFDIDFDSSEENLEQYLKRMRKKHMGDSNTERTWLVANTSNKAIVVRFKQGWDAGDIALVTAAGLVLAVGAYFVVQGAATTAGVAAAGGAVTTASGATVTTTSLATTTAVISGTLGGAGAGMASSVGVGGLSSGETIQPGQFKVFHRPRTEKKGMVIRVLDAKKTCQKEDTDKNPENDFAELRLNFKDSNALTIVSHANKCSILGYESISASDIEKSERQEAKKAKRQAKRNK